MYRSLSLVLCALLLVSCAPPQPASTTANEPAVTQDYSAMPEGGFRVATSRIEYAPGVQGFLAEPVEVAEAPGVLLIHEWWGLNAHMQETARRLATHGYRVLAVDLYGGKVASTRDEAQAYRSAVSPEAATANLDAAVAILRSRGSPAVASWGFCYGGGQSANILARAGPVDAAIVYYGDLSAPLASPDGVEVPVLLIYGSEDSATPASKAQELVAILEERDQKVELHVYPGRGHAFANPSNAGHDRADTRDAWEKTLAFLGRTIG